jgi:hypothetical protein
MRNDTQSHLIKVRSDNYKETENSGTKAVPKKYKKNAL